MLGQLRELAAAADKIYLDIDWDVLDPAFFPAVNRPVPFGVSPTQLLQIIEAIYSPKVVGLILSEFDPGHDHHDRSLSTIVWLVEFLLLRLYET